MSKNEKLKEWERRNGESSAAYEAFKLYLEMPARSLQKVAQKSEKSLTQIKEWSAKFDWVNRTAAYDSSIVEATRQSIIAARRKYIAEKLRLSKKLRDEVEKSLDNLNPKRASLYTTAQALDIAFKIGDSAFADSLEIDGDEKVTTIEIVCAEKK